MVVSWTIFVCELISKQKFLESSKFIKEKALISFAFTRAMKPHLKSVIVSTYVFLQISSNKKRFFNGNFLFENIAFPITSSCKTKKQLEFLLVLMAGPLQCTFIMHLPYVN